MSTCFWCGHDPERKMPNDISPHATYCPHYRSPPSAQKVLADYMKLLASMPHRKRDDDRTT